MGVNDGVLSSRALLAPGCNCCCPEPWLWKSVMSFSPACAGTLLPEGLCVECGDCP